ncbi:hypothetical protein J0K78_03490 [Halobacillus sp. GSS1]|uniref:hypothetical protein n=1 Tax=Halobacillus sp. GSS1 TaxID=2815919 RepID=UPI001A8E6357|nr:hypothetical protein [Halobacillus sp. GSS1]MBN9653318.1 hypothetical protein [Halobacillus sp. GSS1]
MKKLIMIIAALFFITSCSNDENVDATPKEDDAKPLEEQIVEVMKENDFFPPEDIVDYEIEDDYIYVFMHSQLNGLSLAILKHNSDSVEWLIGDQAIQETASFVYKGENEVSPVVTVVFSDAPDVKDVKVLGEHAKRIQLTQELTDDYSVELKYWVHFSEKVELNEDGFLDDPPSKSVEYIR